MIRNYSFFWFRLKCLKFLKSCSWIHVCVWMKLKFWLRFIKIWLVSHVFWLISRSLNYSQIYKIRNFSFWYSRPYWFSFSRFTRSKWTFLSLLSLRNYTFWCWIMDKLICELGCKTHFWNWLFEFWLRMLFNTLIEIFLRLLLRMIFSGRVCL